MSLLEMSLFGGVIISVVIILRAIFLNRLPKKTFLAMWGVALVRLLVPYSLPFALSVYTLARRIAPPQAGRSAVGGAYFPASASTIGAAPSAAVPPSGNAPAGMDVWTAVWLAGMVICAMFFAVSFVKCFREFRTSLPVENDYAAEWLRTHRLRRRVEIRQSDRVSSPLTYGVLRPVILMPKTTDWSDTEALGYVLCHEYVHIRRFDGVTKLLLAAALCLHWFNPMVWAMFVLANRDIEISCDETVIRTFGAGSRADYAMTLIRMEEKKSGIKPLCSSFSKNAIEERIVAVMKTKKRSIAALLVAICLVAGMAVTFSTSASAGDAAYPEELNSKSTVYVETDTMMSYVSPEDGKTYYSWDDGKTWAPLTDEEYEAMFPTPEIEWWTAEEYEEWLESEKEELQKVIGSKGWTPSTGWFTWTQEMVDDAIRGYEETLKEIKRGVKISKAVYDENGVATHYIMSYDPSDIATGTEYDFSFSDSGSNDILVPAFDPTGYTQEEWEQIIADIESGKIPPYKALDGANVTTTFVVRDDGTFDCDPEDCDPAYPQGQSYLGTHHAEPDCDTTCYTRVYNPGYSHHTGSHHSSSHHSGSHCK